MPRPFAGVEGHADDGLLLVGPGAPTSPSSIFGRSEEEHPVKARLLARARAARGEATAEDEALLARTEGRAGAFDAPAAPPGSAPDSAGVETPAAPFVTRTPELPKTARAPLVDPGPLPWQLPEPEFPDERVEEAPPPPSANIGASAPTPPSSDANFSSRRDPVPSESLAHLTPPPGSVASELDRIARRVPLEGPDVGRLSPSAFALFALLGGVTSMVSIGIFAKPFEEEGAPPTSTAPTTAPPPKVTATPLPVDPRPVRKRVPGPWRIADDASKAELRTLTGQVGKEPFLRAIQSAGLTKSEAYAAYGALKTVVDLDHCSARDRFTALVRRADKSLVAFEFEKSKEEVYQAKRGADGRLEGKRLDLAVGRNQVRRAFVHTGGSLDDSGVKGGFDPGLGKVLETAFRGHLSASELRAGDRLRVIAQEVTVLGEFARYSGVEAIEVLRAGKDPIRIYYYAHPEQGGYFDKDGRAPYEGGWRVPIPGAPVTSKFNMKRMHPVLKKVMPHTGTDFGAPAGTPIGSTAPGTIAFIGWGGPSGNLVKVKHDGGYESGYAHLIRFEPGLGVGDRVDRLQTIGYCGSTGRSTGPHLHFTMKKNGEFIDPESLSLDGLRVLPPSHREEFGVVRQKYDPILDAIVLPDVPSELLTPAPAAAPAAGMDPMMEESAPPAPAGSGDPGAEADGADSSPMAAPLEAPAPTSAPEGKPSAPARPAGGASTTVPPSAIFLSDQELLRMQSASHDGEVAP